jgi:hypothetical protein
MPFTFTKPATDIWNPLDAGSNARGASMAESRTWGIEVETALNELAGDPPARVLNTYVDASTYGVNPAAADITPGLQAAIDANPGCTIVIPNFNGAVLKSLTAAFLDKSNTRVLLDGCRIERPAGTFLKDGVIAVRKRVPGGAKLDNVIVEGRAGARFYFHPVQSASFFPAAGTTVLPITSSATSRFDFVVLRTRAGVTKFLSQSSDLTAGGPTGVTMASPSLAGDGYTVRIAPGNERTGAVAIEGTSTDRVGRVELKGYDVAGYCYVANEAAHVDEVNASLIRTFGCVDRATIYPYLSMGKLTMDRMSSFGKMDEGPDLGWNAGTGVALCAYGLNINPLAGHVIEDMQVSNLHIEDMDGHAVGIGGDVRRVSMSNVTSINPGFYHLVGFGGATEPREVTIRGMTCEGVTTAEAIYWTAGGLDLDCVVRGGKQVRVGGSGTTKSGNRVKSKIINPTESGSFYAQDQNELVMDVDVTGGPAGATTSASLANLTRAVGRLSIENTSNAGDGVLVNNVVDSLIDIRCNGKSRGVLIYGGSTGNDVRTNTRGCTNTGVEIASGADYNRVHGVARGATSPAINAGTGNAISDVLT